MKILGAPVIAELATLPRELLDDELCVTPLNQGHVAESFRTLRTALTFLAQAKSTDAAAPVIVITSPSPNDGKTTTAANLAAAFAETCERVVLVKADFRASQDPQFFGTIGRPPPFTQLKNFDGLGPEQFLRSTANPAIRVVDLSRLRGPAGELSRATARVVVGVRPWVDVIIKVGTTTKVLHKRKLSTSVKLSKAPSMVTSTHGVSESFSFHVRRPPPWRTLTMLGGVRSRAISYVRGSVTLPRLPATSFAVKPIV